MEWNVGIIQILNVFHDKKNLLYIYQNLGTHAIKLACKFPWECLICKDWMNCKNYSIMNKCSFYSKFAFQLQVAGKWKTGKELIHSHKTVLSHCNLCKSLMEMFKIRWLYSRVGGHLNHCRRVFFFFLKSIKSNHSLRY